MCVNKFAFPASDLLDSLQVCLDVLKDVVARFGNSIQPYHDDLLKTLLPILESPKDLSRKRTSSALGALVMSLTDKSFQMLMDKVGWPTMCCQTLVSPHFRFSSGKHHPELAPRLIQPPTRPLPGHRAHGGQTSHVQT
jgi:hypothetical protein